MKALLLLGILLIMSTMTFAQGQKYQIVTSNIITNSKAKILSQNSDNVKAEFPKTYTLKSIQTICDTTAKSKAVSDWQLNYDKNYEKQYIIDNKKLLITIYFNDNDKYLYFEFN